MHAAAQSLQGAIAHAPPARPKLVLVAVAYDAAAHAHGVCAVQRAAPAREFFIQGLTLDGRGFRPSDWAERLASAMSSFRPDSVAGCAGGIGAFIGYSPYCVPTVVDGVKCVIVNEALRGIEPMAWDFVMNFARENQLQLGAACASTASSSAQN